MAVTKLKKVGYGQIEPNRINAEFTKQVYAQLPADEALTVIENGMALIYDAVNGKVKPVSEAGKGLVGLVVNEIILEDDRYQQDCDYAMFNREESKYQAAIPAIPRILGLTVGDTFTTNTIKVTSTYESGALPAGTKFIADTDGYWKEFESETEADMDVVLQVVKDYTMPDGQRGVKFVVSKVNTNATTEAE